MIDKLFEGYPGYLRGSLYLLRQQKLKTFTLKPGFYDSSIICGSMQLDLRKTGATFTIQSGETDVAQFLCAGYSIALLHLLCQPHGIPSKRVNNAIYMDEFSQNIFLIASLGLGCDQVPHYSNCMITDLNSLSDVALSTTVWEAPTFTVDGATTSIPEGNLPACGAELGLATSLGIDCVGGGCGGGGGMWGCGGSGGGCGGGGYGGGGCGGGGCGGGCGGGG